MASLGQPITIAGVSNMRYGRTYVFATVQSRILSHDMHRLRDQENKKFFFKTLRSIGFVIHMHPCVWMSNVAEPTGLLAFRAPFTDLPNLIKLSSTSLEGGGRC